MTKDKQGENERTQQDERDTSSTTIWTRTYLLQNMPPQHEVTHFCGRVVLVRLWKFYSPYGLLLTTMVATACTFVASWDCHIFYSAEASSEGGVRSGGGYGIWSLEDSGQQCQLWGDLVASHRLDTALRIARLFSMMAMLAGLEAIAILGQVLPTRGRLASSMVTLGGLISWLVDSILRSEWRFNVWSSFFILTYLWMVLFTKCVLFKKCSLDALWKLTRILMLLCCAGSVGIFTMLASNFCMIDTSTSPQSQVPFNASLSHEGLALSTGKCVLGQSSSIAVVVCPLLWLFGWIGARFLVSIDKKNHDTSVASTDGKPLARSATCSTGEALSQYDTDEKIRNNDVEFGEDDTFQISNSELSFDCLQIASSYTTEISELDFNDDSGNQLARGKLQPVDGHDRSCNTADENTSSDNPTSANFYDKCDTSGDSSTDIKLDSEPTSTHWKLRFDYACWFIISISEIFIVAVLVGAYLENERATLAPDTSNNFITEVVCAFDESGVFRTFDKPDQAHLAGYKIAHCGPCGECSNASDIARYVETRTTVTETSKKCSLEAIFGSDEELESCLERENGFTPSCTTCWAENMRNTAKHCLWTCLSNTLTGVGTQDAILGAIDYDWLSQCAFCDEKQSGSAFVECSGVARRRLGIQSEFQRDPAELCPWVDVNYLSPSWMQDFSK